MIPNWQAEIVDLHAFFTAWLAGDLPNTDAAFARCSSTMAPGCTMISPRGELIERDDLLASLRAAHGVRPDLRIWIERPVLRQASGDVLLVTYEEWQTERGVTTRRHSTALFVTAPQTPYGLAWAHIHETWAKEQPHADA
jgi:hypothetical protein